jgi:IclR family pca regulon transcriptional regulator
MVESHMREKVVEDGSAEVRQGRGSAKKGDSDGDFMTSLARGLAVVQAFSQAGQQLTVSSISQQTGISRAAVRRCLYTLSKLGFAGSYDQKQYFLRPKVLALGHAYFSSNPLAKVAQPVLERVSRTLAESCSVATLQDLEVFYIARAAVSRIMSIDLHVGTRLPAYCTSMGRVLLANLPEEQLRAYFAQATLARKTDRTVTSIAKLKAILELVRRSGYAIVDQELEIGLRSLAVPIRNARGEAIASMNVGCHAQRISLRDMQTTFLRTLREAAREIETML